MTADVVVIGAGFAGLSAAVRLADAGLKVVVAEEAPRLGGRATAFTDRDSGERVDNGQHVLFGCYRETYAFLKRIGTDGLAPLERRLEVAIAGEDGRAFVLSCPPWPPPWHLVGGLLKWRALPWRDRVSALGLARVLNRIRRDGAIAVAGSVPPGQTVSAWLIAHGQSPLLCRWLWDPLAIAALNQSPETAAAAPFVRVIGELFGPRVEDSAIGLPRVPLDELFATAASRIVESLGGAVRLKAPARIGVDAASGVSRVRVGDVEIEVSQVVSTVPWHALGRIWIDGPPPALAQIVSDAQRLQSSPIVTVNLWFDRPVMTERFVGLVGGAVHWAFDKSAIFGQGAGHVSVVASGAVELAAMDNAAITAIAERDLQRALPAARSSRVLRSVVVREHRATFSLAPGGPPRPATMTPVRGFYLAGDWTDTGLPGTIESAVLSGHRAAAALLAGRASARAAMP